MRYAITSDVHSNLQAWMAVLTDCQAEGVDCIICLGDVIGYGPNPNEVLDSMAATGTISIMGNHDAAVVDYLEPGVFNEFAAKTLEVNERLLTPQNRERIANFPMRYEESDFACAHGDFVQPEKFRYVFNASEAHQNWRHTTAPLLFVGHTHRPGIYVIGHSQSTYQVPPQDFVLEQGKRYIINPGSVGFPRDKDLRASYVIYDDAKHSIRFRRIPFNIEEFRSAVIAAGLPQEEYWFLALRDNPESFPERLALSREITEANLKAKARIDLGKRRKRRRRYFPLFLKFRGVVINLPETLALVLIIIAAAVVIPRIWPRHQEQHPLQKLQDDFHLNDAQPAAEAAAPAAQDGNLLEAWLKEIRINGALSRYAQVPHPSLQKVKWQDDALVVFNGLADVQIEIRSARIPVTPAVMPKLQMSLLAADIQCEPKDLGITLTQFDAEGRIVTADENQSIMKRKDGAALQKTCALQPQTASLQLSIRINRLGNTPLKNIKLIPKT